MTESKDVRVAVSEKNGGMHIHPTVSEIIPTLVGELRPVHRTSS